MRPKWAPEGLPGGVWAAWGPLGPLLGGCGRLLARSGRLLEPSWGLLGRSWGLPGRAWGSFGPPGELLLELFGPLLKAPLRSRENHEIRRQYSTSRGFSRSRGPQNRSKIAPRRVWARLEASWGLVGLSGASLGPSVGRLRGSWAVPGWLQTGRGAPELARLTSGQVQKKV